MKSRRFLDNRVGYLLLAVFTLVGVAAPAALTTSVSAATLTDRSIQLSSSKANDTNVSYTVNFTPVSTAGAVMITFCSDSPIPGQTCTAPTGFDASSAATSDGGTVETSVANNIIKYTKASMSSAQSIEFTGIHNPTNVTTSSTGFYARIVTYASGSYTGYTSPTVIGTTIDYGGVAMAITNPIDISAAVRETMTFCVSKVAPGPSCGATGQAVTTPSLTLGHGTPAALDATATDDDNSFAQISTNAVSGASVSMKIDNDCGGLKRVGASTCEIAPSTTSSTLPFGAAALFGLNVADSVVASGGLDIGDTVANSPYNTSGQYGMNWVSGNATGVGSTYGDEIFDTGGQPISDQNVELTFAATVTPTTPAGLYKAAMNLIATGTY